MTDRLKGVVVTFEEDVREDDAQPTIDAIKQLRNVLDVSPVTATVSDDINRKRIFWDITGRLRQALSEENKR